jgi:hypothetical protein
MGAWAKAVAARVTSEMVQRVLVMLLIPVPSSYWSLFFRRQFSGEVVAIDGRGREAVGWKVVSRLFPD